MKGKAVIASLVSFMLLSTIALAGCKRSANSTNTSSPNTTNKPTNQVVLRFEHNMTEQHPWHAGATKFAEILGDKTGGKLGVQIFPNGSLAQQNWKLILEQIQTGSIDMTVESTISFASLNPELFALNLPYLFDSVDQYKAFMKNPPPVVQKWFQKLEEKNLKVVGVWTRPFRQFGNTRREIVTPKDMAGLKFRVPPVDIFVEVFETLKAKPLPLPIGEVYTGLQLGTIDGVDNAPVTVCDDRSAELLKYYTLSDYMGDGVLVVMNLNRWKSLDKDTQTAIQDAVAAAEEVVYNRDKELETAALEKMKQKGIKITTLTNEQKQAWKEALKPVYDNMKNTIGAQDLEALTQAVAQTRS